MAARNWSSLRRDVVGRDKALAATCHHAQQNEFHTSSWRSAYANESAKLGTRYTVATGDEVANLRWVMRSRIKFSFLL
jgi:hypothetical protein